MLARVRTGLLLARHLGFVWVLYRLRYAVSRRLGWVKRRTSLQPWASRLTGADLSDARLAEPEAYLSYRRADAPRFLFSHRDFASFGPLLARWDEETGCSPVPPAKDILRGRFVHFAHHTMDRGMPPDWHANPFSGERSPADRHWCDLGDFEFGDIKCIWEVNRFAFTYTLARAYARTGDEEYAEAFWTLLESWRSANLPNAGANWKCGQEVALRTMAWCFGLYAFLGSPATTARRAALLAEMVHRSGSRIAANVGYALSQRNNHGLSEAAGLFTIGVLWPEFREAARWRDLGRRHLEEQARRLIYDDGSFSQHSVVYHRLALHCCMWCSRLGDLNGQSLSWDYRDRVARAATWLWRMLNEDDGQAPVYGPSDGSLVLPLSGHGYEDYRPVVQSAFVVATGTRRLAPGPWDEEALWLCGREALSVEPAAPERPSSFAAEEGGYYGLRSANGFALTRCARFDRGHRPSHLDQLHVDLWWRGRRITLDPGTYSYNAAAPWDRDLVGTEWHCTVTVDARSQAERVERFLYLPWPAGQVDALERTAEGDIVQFCGSHDGYARLRPPVRHCRAVLKLGNGFWCVLDRLSSAAEHTYRLHWLFPDYPHAFDPEAITLALQPDERSYYAVVGATSPRPEPSLVRADPGSPRGWWAPYYHARSPALSLAAQASARTVVFWTVFGPAMPNVRLQGPDELRIEMGADGADVDLRTVGG